jgi:signal transduction histidine kinase
MGYLLYYSIKNSGFFSKQSIYVAGGSAIPLVTNIMITTRIIEVPLYTTAISFSISMVFISLAVFRFDFLKVAPIALQTIVDRISDGFIVLNEEFQVIDFNKALVTTFNNLGSVRRNENILHILERTSFSKKYDELIAMIKSVKETQTSINVQRHIKVNNFDKHFKIEITPIISKNNYLGTIILLKDITESIKYIETIEEKHAIMMEQERLASLGQLIGGIAHNLNTPIMSIAGAVEGLKDLVNEYEESLGDDNITIDDHHEIAGEMRVWLDKIKPYTSYMSDVISAVKGQARHFNQTVMLTFTVEELVKRIELLMKYELMRFNCELKTFIKVNKKTEIYGDINSLVQILDNIIINAIQAYEGKKGTIELTIESKEEDILFTIKDYAKGIPESIKGKLLKEMVTTKGKDGTGLGMYMSYSTIRGLFGGKMWFESEEGKGTTFFIQLPHEKLNTNLG